MFDEAPAPPVPGAARGRAARLIPFAIAVALLAALVHMAPFWRAEALAPAGWTFTGNLYPSIDFIQYRVWMRQSQTTGPFVPNSFTSEPNKTHLPVVFYYVLGKIALWGNWPPEYVMAYGGAVLAFSLALLLFVVVRRFLKTSHRAWWVFLVILLGGGLGAYYKLLARFEAVQKNSITRRLFVEPISDPRVLTFEDYRGNYVFATLFDTHYLFVWMATTASIYALYLALRRFSLGRLALAMLLSSFATLVHIYEGVTLTVIAAGIAFLLWRKNLIDRNSWITLGGFSAAATAVLLWLLVIQRSSGIPLPVWRELPVAASMLFIAYPVGWGLLAWGLSRLWAKAGQDECFLLGWLLAGTAIALSGPLYPYPNRGVMTLPLALYLVAGLIYFSRYPRVSWRAAMIVILLLGATPSWTVLRWRNHVRFKPSARFMFVGAEERDIMRILTRRASSNDVLLCERPAVPWLAPEYPGRHYLAHFFLTVDYANKKDAVEKFFAGQPDEQAAFLKRNGIRFLFVDPDRSPERFLRVPGLTPLRHTRAGSLFEFHLR